MAFEKQKYAALVAGEPFVTFSAARGFSDGETFPVLDHDFSGEDLVCRASVGPGHPSIASLSVDLDTEQKSWQEYKDECVPVKNHIPCGGSLEDVITTTLLTLSWQASTFDAVPTSDKPSDPIDLYFEVHRSDGTGPRFLSGRIILTERVR